MSIFNGTTGPRDARIAIVGEAWGKDEEAAGKPFVGSSGQELNRILSECGLNRDDIFCTNVISARPERNQVWRFFIPRDSAKDVDEKWGLHPTPQTYEHMCRLWEQLERVNPDLVIACGNYALWALTDAATISYKSADEYGAMEGGGRLVPSGIINFRGSMLRSRKPQSFKVLPIIHPAAVLREWAYRSMVVHDLKTRVPMALKNDWDPPPFNIIFRPTLDDVVHYFSHRLARLRAGESLECSIDLETAVFETGRYVTCISFCTEPGHALTIPFVDKDGTGLIPYWRNGDEPAVVSWMLKFLRHPGLGCIGQNFIYDQTYIHDHWGVVPKLSFDTMLAHHLVWPGTPKDLGYLSSLHCRYHRYWKEDNREWDSKASPDAHFLYNGEDAIRTYEIAIAQRSLIKQIGFDALWAERLEVAEFAREMSFRGVLVDKAERKRQSIELLQAAEEREQRLLKIIPQSFIDDVMGKKNDKPWYRSAKQQQVVFYDILGLPIQRHKKTGNATLGKQGLEVLKEKAPIFGLLFESLEELRSISVYRSNFIEATLDPDGRMRCSFNSGGTETFRFSSNENPLGRGTNLQNVPGEEQ